MDNGGIWPGDESYFQNIRETSLQDQIEQLTKELAEARAEIERKDALIKQMFEALDELVDLKDRRHTLAIEIYQQARERAWEKCRAAIKAAKGEA